MGVSKTHITNLLEMRFDFLSARNVLNNWRKSAGIKEDIDDFDDNNLKSLLAYLKENAPDAKRVQDAVERLIINKDAQEKVQAAEAHVEEHREEAPAEEHHEDVPVEEVPVEEHHEEAPVEEAPVEEAPSEEAPAENAEEAPAENAEEAPAENKDNGGKKKKKKH